MSKPLFMMLEEHVLNGEPRKVYVNIDKIAYVRPSEGDGGKSLTLIVFCGGERPALFVNGRFEAVYAEIESNLGTAP